jgi:Putative DNA-binding domain
MHDYPYNPFGKDPATVIGDDLDVLRNVAEGWYVDYKRQGLDVADLARHVSAFANQYGGWLFFGIAEATDGSRTAGSFPGITTADVPALSLKLREAISSHASPPLFYEEHVVHGPCKMIGLAVGFSIVIVGIPQGVDPPYIHSSGRIYRRLADQSKPREETDRHALDVLWERGRTYRTRVSDRLRKTPDFPDVQKESTWAFVYLCSDLRLPDPEKLITYEEFRNLVRNDPPEDVSISLQGISSCEFGYIGRYTEGNNPQLGTVGLRWWHGGVARLDIPINTWPVEQFKAAGAHYDCTNQFIELIKSQGHKNAQICDFSQLVWVLAALTHTFLRIRAHTADTRPLYAACEIRNVFYKVPFFNSAKFMTRCASDGVPVVTDRTIVFPERPYFDNMFEVRASATDDSGETNPASAIPFIMTAGLIHWMLSSVGIATDPEDWVHDPDLYVLHGPHTNLAKGP